MNDIIASSNYYIYSVIIVINLFSITSKLTLINKV